MSWSETRALYLEFLAQQGFRPKVDEDDDIHFLFEGRHYYIMKTEEQTFFQLLFPNFFSLDDEADVARAATAASTASRSTKVAKVFLNPALDNVSASVELLVDGPAGMQDKFLRCLDIIGVATRQFREAMSARPLSASLGTG
jgi:hypothetical protein